MTEIEPVDADLEELKERYPEGTVLRVKKEDSRIFPEEFRAIVTGHSVVEPGKRVTPLYPGPRVNVSTNPPGYENLDEDVNGGSALRPCEIIGVVGQAEPTDD